jgi:hypothetical protein
MLHLRQKNIEGLSMSYVKISKDYFLNCKFPSRICHKKAVCLDPDNYWEYRGQFNHPYKLKTVRDVVEYFKQEGAIEKAKSKLKEDNWEYFNCLLHGWRRNVLDTDIHKITGKSEISLEERNKTLSPDYYQSLEKMTDDEIHRFNKNHPMAFDYDIIRHGTHRVYAMIGRLIRGEKYIPFYVPKHGFYSPTKNIQFLNELDKLQIPRKEYTICQSSWLSMMGIRSNNDLDIVISSRLREYSLEGYTADTKIHSNIEVFGKNAKKFSAFGCKDDDDLIDNYSVSIQAGDFVGNGYNFCEPRFYFSRIWPENQKKINDQKMIRKFFKDGNHTFYPFYNITDTQWGVNLLPGNVT